MASTFQRKLKHWRRASTFWILRRLVIPLSAGIVKLWMWTWRIEVIRPDDAREMAETPGPAVFAVYHGAHLSLLGWVLKHRRRHPNVVTTTMVSPSRDGQMLADIIARFGQKTVTGSAKKRGAEGLRELIRVTRERSFGLIAVDGPRGPRGVPRQGVFTLARGAGARLYVLAAHGSPCLRAPSWDRLAMPLPFVRVRATAALFHDYGQGPFPGDEQPALQARMLELMTEVGDPMAEVPRPAAAEPAPC